jgi:hypothetical protein
MKSEQKGTFKMEIEKEDKLKLAMDILCEEELNKKLVNRKIEGMYKIMKALEEDPRQTLQQIQKKTALPTSTLYERIIEIKKHFYIRGKFIPKDKTKNNMGLQEAKEEPKPELHNDLNFIANQLSEILRRLPQEKK